MGTYWDGTKVQLENINNYTAQDLLNVAKLIQATSFV